MPGKNVMMNLNGKFVKRGGKKHRAIVASQKSVLVPLIKAVAKSSALKLLETKFVSTRFEGTQFNSAINGGFSEMYPLIPGITPGSGTYQRLDDTLQPLTIRTNWHVALSTASRTMNIRVVLYCLQSKSIRHFPDLATFTSGPSFLRSGDSSLISTYNGKITDENLVINTDEYTLLKKYTFNLMSNVGSPNGDTVAGNSPNVQPSFKNLSYTHKLKSQLKYDPLGTGTTYPKGHAPFWVLGYSHTDGTAPDITYKDVIVSCMTSMTFKDA